MPAKIRDLTGQKFGRLTALGQTGTRLRNAVVWFFLCDCGKVVEKPSGEVTAGRVSSCGCLAADVSRETLKTKAQPARLKTSTTHGQSRTATFYTWSGMKDRCMNPSSKDFPKYGGRGITVCDRWLNSFENFLVDMGHKPNNMTLDRIDVNGNYEPSNCRWATAREQANNRRVTVFLTLNGETKALTEWSEITGIGPKTILYRLKKGWTDEQALTTPVSYGNSWNNGNRRKAA